MLTRLFFSCPSRLICWKASSIQHVKILLFSLFVFLIQFTLPFYASPTHVLFVLSFSTPFIGLKWRLRPQWVEEICLSRFQFSIHNTRLYQAASLLFSRWLPWDMIEIGAREKVTQQQSRPGQKKGRLKTINGVGDAIFFLSWNVLLWCWQASERLVTCFFCSFVS